MEGGKLEAKNCSRLWVGYCKVCCTHLYTVLRGFGSQNSSYTLFSRLELHSSLVGCSGIGADAVQFALVRQGLLQTERLRLRRSLERRAVLAVAHHVFFTSRGRAPH